MDADRQRRSAEGLAWLLSDSESSDEFCETQLMTVSTYSRGGGQAKPGRPEDLGDTPRHSKFQARENFLHVTGSSLSSAPRGLSSVVERQGVGEQGISSPKKMQSVLWGKGGSKPSYPGAAAAAAAASASAAAAGGLPRVTPRKNGAQEKKSVGGASKLALGGTFRSRGQRISATPVEPATFPPISGIPQPGRPKSYTLVLSGTKQSDHSGAGKKSVVSWATESEAVVGEDKDPNRDPAPKGQVSRPCSSSLPTLPPPTAPRAHVFTHAASVHSSEVSIGCPSVTGSLRCHIGLLFLGTNIKVALPVSWARFSTLGLFPASSERLGLGWKGGLVAELGRGIP